VALDFPIEDLMFILAAAGGAGVLAARLLVDDDGQRRVHQPFGRPSAAITLSAFAAFFGIGGLMAGHVLDVHGAQAVVAATGAGVVGIGLAMLVRDTRRRAKD
jgi:hypothetical protein